MTLFSLSILPQIATASGPNILVWGDSLSAGYGLRPQEAWPALLVQRLNEARLDYSVANQSISGETTAGGRARFKSALEKTRPAIVIIELGANDGLRGLPLNEMKNNLLAMIDAAHDSKAKVLLVGMRLPPNYGPYADQFANTYNEIHQHYRGKLAFLPFFFTPIVDRPELFQADRLHPLAAAQPLLLDHLWPTLKPLLK